MLTRFMGGWILCGVSVLILAGCTNYYRVTDPASGKTYYTTKVSRVDGGAVKIKDAKSGDTVTLQSSEVHEISQRDFEAGAATGTRTSK